MPKKNGNISLSSYDDIFQTDQSREEAQQERVQEIPLSELHPFKGHPFKVLDDDAMQKTVESIAQFGVMTPAIARPRPEGGYELIAGHRRHHASELAGKETMPVIVREMDDDAATILMVDSNLQRETILPSERAFAYKMKLEAMNHQGERVDLTCSQLGNKSAGKKSSELLAEQVGQSKNQIFRYIRLTELIPELLDMVDEKKIAFNPAVELSYLKKEEQKDFLEAMDYAQATPSLSQAQRLKKFSQEGKCSLDAMCAIMSEERKVSWIRSPSKMMCSGNIFRSPIRRSRWRIPSLNCWNSGRKNVRNLWSDRRIGMFTEKEMSDALKWLFDLYQPEDYEAYDEEEVGSEVLCLPEICMALRDKVGTPYEYTIRTNLDRGFEYRGKELFVQRACLLYTDMEISVFDMVDTSYNRELWLLEDMSFAIVHNVSMVVKSEDYYYTTEYRSIVKLLKERDDLFFTPESLMEELDDMCIPQWESEATIYEL